MSGTLAMVVRPGDSNAAAISFSALFLAPQTWTRPVSGASSGPCETTWKPSIRMMVAAPAGGTTGRPADRPVRRIPPRRGSPAASYPP